MKWVALFCPRVKCVCACVRVSQGEEWEFLSTTELNNSVEDYYSFSRVGVVCRMSPNLNMELFPNALS